MRATRQLIGLALALGLAARPVTGGDLRDPYFGEALYHAYQGQYFDALQRLDTELAQYHVLDEPKLDTLHYHINDAEFSVGDFELDYRMHQRAGRAIKAVLEGTVDEAVRNEAAFSLARIHFQKGQLEVDAGEPERGLISYRLIDGTFEYRLDGAPCSLVHAVVELKVADREFGVVNVIVKRIELGFVQNVVLGELGVEPLECIEILPLVSVIERLAKIEVPQVVAGGRTDGKSQG